ncbi:MAG TPA: TIGR02556 family CRISPR-associated protein [Hydrogenobaculum sp.]|nr:TIGR02556 family CRISPR-associated protein [Hydrogenobaculum sp.]
MIESVFKLGKMFGENAGKTDYDYIKAENVIIIEFDENGEFSKVDQEKFTTEKLSKYFYKKAKGSNPPSLSPTLNLNKEVGKTLRNLKTILKKILDTLEDLQDQKGITLVSNILKALDQEGLENVIKERMSKESAILTIKVGDKYVGDIDFLVKAILTAASDEGKDSKSVGVCAFCLQEKEISGDISPFKFYTIDKPGYITGGFNKKEAYKNFPICYECKDYIKIGREKIENFLKFSIYGNTYYIIPDFVIEDEYVKNEILNILFNQDFRNIKLTESQHKKLMSSNEEILDLLIESKDVMTLDFLFLEKTNSAEVINLHIQDIYPSRLKELFEAKDKVEAVVEKPFTYAVMYKFFSKTDKKKRNDDLIKYFFELLDKTFRSIRVDEKFLINFLLRQIRDALSPEDLKENIYKDVIKDAYGVFLFIKLTTKEVKMEDVKENLREEAKSIEEFVERLPALDSATKKALFLMGVLTEYILTTQYLKGMKAKPFMKKLNGLKMNANDVRGLLPEIRNKLEEYEEYGPNIAKIFSLASNYLAIEDALQKMSIEELNFYFALGMGMYDAISKKFIFVKKEENNEEQA